MKGLSVTAGLRLEYEKMSMNYFSDSNIDFDFFLKMAMPPLNIPFRNLNAAPLLEGKEKNDYVHNKQTFMLVVQGDSMINAGIFSGDYVVVEKQENAENGDKVVALVEDSATRKNPVFWDTREYSVRKRDCISVRKGTEPKISELDPKRRCLLSGMESRNEKNGASSSSDRYSGICSSRYTFP